MDRTYIKLEDKFKNYGKDVDELIKIRDNAKINLARSRMALLNMGVKTVMDGVMNYLPGLDVNKFEKCDSKEFYWEAEYEDGTILKQFDGGKQNHYGNIDQCRLRLFRWISNFNDETDNAEKRVIITLNFRTGLFDFLNGYVPQEVRGEVMNGFDQALRPKLIFKIINRASSCVNFEGKVDEVCFYNRYLIGYEFSEGVKLILCIEPNGFVHLWEE